MIVLGRKPGGGGGGGAPSGAAGGALAGTYPNPTLAALTWTDFAGGDFLNGAAALGAPYGSPAYAISQGILFLRGAVNPGTDGVIIQLPAPAVPADSRIVIAFGDGTFQAVEITDAGIIDFFGNPGTSAFLDGIYVSL